MILLNLPILTFLPLEFQRYLQISKWGCTRWKLICLCQTRYAASTVSVLATAKIHVKVVKSALGVVKMDMTAKVAKKIPCVKILRLTTYQTQNSVLSEKLQTKRQKESSTSIMYRNQICHFMLQLWKLPRMISRHKPVRVKYSHRPLWTNQPIQVQILTITSHCRNLLLQVLNVSCSKTHSFHLHKVGRCKYLYSSREKYRISLEGKTKTQRRPAAQGGKWSGCFS